MRFYELARFVRSQQKPTSTLQLCACVSWLLLATSVLVVAERRLAAALLTHTHARTSGTSKVVTMRARLGDNLRTRKVSPQVHARRDLARVTGRLHRPAQLGRLFVG